MSLERHHVWRVRTPEGVSFTVRLASPVLRSAALLIDVGVISTVWSIIGLVLSLTHLLGRDVAGLVLTVGYFLFSEGYFIATEWLWRGRSVGKRIMRLRVVDTQGLRLSFAQVVLRNLLRFIDVLPALYLVGGLAALANRRGQRLGDLAADTLVVWEPPQPQPDFAALRSDKYNSLREHAPVVARLRQAISPAQARAVWAAVARRDQFEPEARVRLFAELAGYLRKTGGVPLEVAEGVSDEQFVRNVVDVLYVSR